MLILILLSLKEEFFHTFFTDLESESHSKTYFHYLKYQFGHLNKKLFNFH